MDSISERIESTLIQQQVLAKDIVSILDNLPAKVKTLSLDCFDTILWRKAATPSDVFFDLQNKPTFKKWGLTTVLRMQAEDKARKTAVFARSSSEVNLRDIYLTNNPKLSKEDLSALEAEEMQAEIEACYPFWPLITLIKAARAKGLSIIIVSDTYLTEDQLTELLQHTIPADALACVMKVFVSNAHGRSKADGLFKHVLKYLNVQPGSVLHVGDNIRSDFEAAIAIGINAVHLLQHENGTGELIRMHDFAGPIIDPAIGVSRSKTSPYRGILASSNFDIKKPESVIGYATLGPIMYGFGRFIAATAEDLQLAGKKVKILFLMRDGYLPYKVCQEIKQEAFGACVNISRFGSHAATFRCKADVDEYLLTNISSLRFYDMSKQLLIPEKLISQILERVKVSPNPINEYITAVQNPEILDIIFKNSKAYRGRLYAHLSKAVGLERGDTLLFVDLGYTGTAQNKLAPVFKDEKNIDIYGCYFIALRTPDWRTSRTGLIDAKWCDDRAMLTLVHYIALLEQLSTANESSVIDYHANGDPIYADANLSSQQHDKLDLIQNECLHFVKDACAYEAKLVMPPSMRIMQDTAMAELTRLLFFPTKLELEYLKSFQFDLNLGTGDILEVIDYDKGLEGLRKRGLFFMEKNLKTMRTNYPAELRYAGIDQVLTLILQHRIGFDMRVNEMSLRRETLSIISIRGQERAQFTLEAKPTYDGYFNLIVPVGNGDYQVGILFGLNYQWLQIESAELIDTQLLYSARESENTIDATNSLIIQQMQDHGSGVFECLAKSGFLVYMPSVQSYNVNYALRIVFRPIAKQQS